MFPEGRSLVIACDVGTLDALGSLVRNTHEAPQVAGYKVGFSLALRYGLGRAVDAIRAVTGLPVVYDHQKAGTDIPQMGEAFAASCADAQVQGVIVFPQAGPVTLAAFVNAIKAHGMTPIVGAVMSHRPYLASEGGYVADSAALEIYLKSIELGVKHFVVPATKPEAVQRCASLLSSRGLTASLMMPGIGGQGGNLSEAFRAALPSRPYAIVGSKIYAASDPRLAVREISVEIEAVLQ